MCFFCPLARRLILFGIVTTIVEPEIEGGKKR
jgi:hypothetical protein